MELITNRTESDALLGNEKGTYGYADLNRVETAVKELLTLFPQLAIKSDLQTKTDWGLPGAFSAQEWPTNSQMRRYLGNVSFIKGAFGISVKLPASMSKLSWKNANNIENVLKIAMERAAGTIQAFQYSGEIFAGEE